MAVFNSLGSNYTFGFALRALFANDFSKARVKLEAYLSHKYDGQAILTYKGREAIYTALKLAKLPAGAAVAINGLTCYAVYEAVVKAGFNIHYLDIEPGKMDFAPTTLERSLKANPNIKAVIVQNTLGVPANIAGIKKICSRNNLILIEDLAHSVGAQYSNGAEAGTSGDFTMLSFGQDKIIDAVSGGALIIRNQKYQNSALPPAAAIPPATQTKGVFYPILTWKIRKLYPIGLGKILHAGLKKAGFLLMPMAPGLNGVHKLANWYSSLALKRFKGLEENIKHRRQIAAIYTKKLSPEIQLKTFTDALNVSTNLRFPITVESRDDLMKHLKASGIYVSDIWYDAPVAPAKYMNRTNYSGQCPQAEKLSAHIINLPTHVNISVATAKKISNKVNQWLESQ